MIYKCTRLRLDWQLEWRDERANFVQQYLSDITFTPNEQEMDMMSKYILWGKDRKTGLNGRQEGLELDTAARTWDTSVIESLDALLESDNFKETNLRQPDDPVYKTPKVKFSRAEARAKASPQFLSNLESLWRQIDLTELSLNFYELSKGKRTTPIRSTLLNRFSTEELQQIQSAAQKLTQSQYLRRKHELVELRRQQYILKDSYSPTIFTQPTWQFQEKLPLFWDTDITILPLGLKSKSPLDQKIYSTEHMPEPQDFTESELKQLSKKLWTSQENSAVFDFTNPSHISILDSVYLEAKDFINSEEFNELESNLDKLIGTYEVYCALAPLKDFQKEILDLKRQHKTNDDIAATINKKYGHNYTLNYISTLYHKTILGTIAATAKLHREVCENLFYPENFKICIDCGRNLLKTNENFMRKSKVKDGFDCRCKACAKILRDKRG